MIVAVRYDNGAPRNAHLSLHVRNLVGRECILVKRDLCDLQESQEAKFAGQQEEQTLSGFASSGGSANTVNVIARIIRRVELDNPVHLGNVETTSGDVRAEEDTGGCIAEFEKGVGPLLLLLLALVNVRR